MCGIFGVLRAGTPGQNPAIDTAVAAAFGALGRRSVARGKDSAGFAAVPTSVPDQLYLPIESDHTSTDVDIDGTRVIRQLGRFEQAYLSSHVNVVGGALAVLGHTRAATQGSRTVLNASPLLAQTLVGTHNGDVTKGSIPDVDSLTAIPNTDSALVYEALAAAEGDVSAILRVLSSIHGRAALAWVDRMYPNRVYLARAALSPLITAVDEHGNLWWASVPSWFTDLADVFGFDNVTFVPEGTFLIIERDAAGTPRIVDEQRFVPVARSSDHSLGEFVWRDFTPSDRALDAATLTHRTVVVKKKNKQHHGFASVSFREAVEMAEPARAGLPAGQEAIVSGDALLTSIFAEMENRESSAAFTYGGQVESFHSYTQSSVAASGKEPFDDWYADDMVPFTDEDMLRIVREEAQETYLKWVDDGCPDTIPDMLAVVSSDADIDDIAEQLCFTFPESVIELEELMNCHVEHESKDFAVSSF